MNALRIVHAVRSDRFAGVEQFVRRLAIAQAHAGATVHVIGGAPEHLAQALAEAGVSFEPARSTVDVARALRARRRDVDVVNTHMTAADVAAVLAFAGRHRPAIVSTRHFARRRGRFRALPLDPLVRTVLDAEISVSSSVATAIGLPSTVVRSGIESRPLIPVAERTRTVLVVQRLQPEKQTPLAVRAFARSGLASEGWQLDIAGTGDDAAAVADVAAPLGDAVRLLGFRDDVPQLMADAGILLAPTPIEALGLSVLEAMSCGLPVVSAAAGGHLETMGGLDDEVQFAAGDVDAAARALRTLAHDSVRRGRLGAAEHARVDRDFSVEAQVAQTDDVYRRVVAGRSGQ